MGATEPKPAIDVLRGAAESIGGDTYSEVEIAAAAQVLSKSGIVWDWQLREMDTADWDGVPVGLKCAARSFVRAPHAGMASGRGRSIASLTEEQRTFLLIADETGKAPRRLGIGAVSVMTGVGESPSRQMDLCVSTGQVMSIIAGLMLPIPISFLRTDIDAPAADDDDAGPASWLVPVSEDAVFNFLCLASFINFLFCIMDGSYCAYFANTHSRAFGAGWGHFDMSKTINMMIGKSLVHQQIGFMLLIATFLWQSTRWCHPLAWVVLFVCLLAPTMQVATLSISRGLAKAPLWMYHIPFGMRCLFMAGNPLAFEYGQRLKQSAEAQAAELRRELGVDEAGEPLQGIEGTAPLSAAKQAPGRRLV